MTETTEISRGECLAHAQQRCAFCYGLGVRPGRAGATTPCNCVWRAIFRACHAQFRRSTDKEKYVTRVRLELSGSGGKVRRSMYGMKNEEYQADFVLIARRVLTEGQYQMFRYHFLLGADWKLCTRKLGLDRGRFFHEVYRIQQKLGRAYRTCEPYALYPIQEYFAGFQQQGQSVSDDGPVCIDEGRAATPQFRRSSALRAPLKKAAG